MSDVVSSISLFPVPSQVVRVTQVEGGGEAPSTSHNPIIIQDNPPNPDRVTGDSQDGLAIALRELQSSHVHPAFIGRYGSGAAVEVVRDIELSDDGTEVLGTPIEDALGHRYTRYGRKARRNSAGLIFQGESGRVWQVKHSIGLPPESPQITTCDLLDRPPSEVTQGYIVDRIMACKSHEDAAVIAEHWGRSLGAIWDAIKSKVNKESKLSPEALKRHRARYRDASGLDMRAAFVRFCDYLREPGGFKSPKRSGEYRAPKDIGNAIYTPPIPPAVLALVCDRHGLDFEETASDIEAAGGFWPWVAAGDLPIVITEGGKKALAALSQGFIAIGLYGCSCAKSPELSPFIEGEKARRITIAFDSDATYRARLAVVQGVRSAKRHWWDISLAEFAIASWEPSQGKGLDDLPTDAMVRALDRPQSFHAWGRANSRNKLHREMLRDLREGWGDCGDALVSTALRWRNERVYDLSAAQVGYFDPVEFDPAGDRSLIILNGGVGLGKTSSAIRSIVQTARGAGVSILMIVPSINLSVSAAAKLGGVSHVENRAATASFLVTCPESVAKFPLDPMGNPWELVIYDEPNESIKRVLDGSLGVTPEKSRDVIKTITAGAHTVVVGQDDLRTPIASVINRWGGFSAGQVHWQQRRRPQTDIDVFWYQSGLGDPEDRYDPDFKEKGGSDTVPQRYQFLAAMLTKLEAGDRILLATGSQAEARKVTRMIRAVFPDKKAIIIDGKDTPSARRKAFAADPDGFIRDNAPDFLAYTPVINSGVSIDSDYFDCLFQYISPSETASSAWQLGARDRPALGGGKIKERHVYSQLIGLGSPQPEVFTPGYWQDAARRSHLSRNAKMRDGMESLGVSMLAINAIAGGLGSKTDLETPELWELMAMDAIEVYHKADILKGKFEDAGWTVCDADTVLSKDSAIIELPSCVASINELREKFEEATLSIDTQRARTLAKACSLVIGAIRKPKCMGDWLHSAEIKGPIQAAQFKRWDIEQDYMGDSPLLKDPLWWESWLEVGSPWLHRAKLRAALEMDEDAIALATQWHAINRLSSHYPGIAKPEGKPPLSLSDLSYVDLLQSCPHILGFLSGEIGEGFKLGDGVKVRAYSKDSPEVRAVASWCRTHERDLAAFTQHARLLKGFQFTASTPDVKCVHKLLESLGALSRCVDRKGGRSLYALLSESPAPSPSPKGKPKKESALNARRKLREDYRLITAPQVRDAIADNVQLRLAAVSGEIEAIAIGAGFSAENVRTFEYSPITTKVLTELLETPAPIDFQPLSTEPIPTEGWEPTHIADRGGGLECMVRAVEKLNSWRKGLWRCVDIHGYVFDLEKSDLKPLQIAHIAPV